MDITGIDGPRMQNQMDKNMKNEKHTGILQISKEAFRV